jgi:plastocyanin
MELVYIGSFHKMIKIKNIATVVSQAMEILKFQRTFHLILLKPVEQNRTGNVKKPNYMTMGKLTGNNKRLLARMAVLFCLFSIVGACSKSDSGINSGGNNGGKGNPGPNEVYIQNYAFNPSTITITVNTTVTWTNFDGIDHTVTSDTGLFDSGNIGSNKTFSYKFTTTGTFPYHCSIHTYMTGKVIVN